MSQAAKGSRRARLCLYINNVIGRLGVLLPMVMLGFTASFAYADDENRELLFFPSAHAGYSSKEVSGMEGRPGIAADVFFANTSDRVRLLTEVLAATDDFHLERVQMGLEILPKQLLWFGRFHSPLDYWNSHYNHAAFLQGSVHRPDIVEYDGHGGVLPMHAAGFLFEGEQSWQGGAIAYDVLLGMGAKLGEHGIEPLLALDELNIGKSSNVFARVFYRPDDTSLTQYGVFVSRTDFATHLEMLDDVKQYIAGAYAYQSWLNVRITATGLYVKNNLMTEGMASSSRFLAGYIHADYDMSAQWTGYLRYEDSRGTQNDGYLAMFPEFTQRKGVIGARIDLNSHHAFSLEAGLLKMSDGIGKTVAIQWSAVYP